MKLKNTEHYRVVYHKSSFGPAFGRGHDLYVDSSHHVCTNIGNTYHIPWPMQCASSYTAKAIKEMEVFQVDTVNTCLLPTRQIVPNSNYNINLVEQFGPEVNEAINAKQLTLAKAETEVTQLETSLEDGE